VHYVRNGDFVRELLLESQDVNDYAFALGALSHYASDIAGHPAVNQAVAIEYPKLRAKYGKSVRYAQDIAWRREPSCPSRAVWRGKSFAIATRRESRKT